MSLFHSPLTNATFARKLMRFFRADEYGHQAMIGTGDLGYGWVHYGLLRHLKPERVLCVGSRHGFIPAVLAQACKESGRGHVDFVDAGYDEGDAGAWTGVGYWKTAAGKSAFRRFGLGRYITLFVMTTQQFAHKHAHTHYAYIYIDGDHSYQGVKSDYKRFWPLLAKGGYMVFHDVSVQGTRPEGTYGVRRLWREVSKERGGLVLPFEGSGLGVLQK